MNLYIIKRLGSSLPPIEVELSADLDTDSNSIRLGAAIKIAVDRKENLSDANLSGANLSEANLSGAKLIGERPILMIGPIGSRSAYLTAYLTEQGIKIHTGCFSGTLDEFRAAVAKTHGDSVHGREYAAAIALIEAHEALWTPEKKEEGE